MKKEYDAYQSRKMERERHERRCYNEKLQRVSEFKDSFFSELDKLNRLVQRHIYLIDKIDDLQKQQAQSVSETRENLQQDLESTIQEIWLQKQDLGHLVERLETLPEACRFWNDFWSKKSLPQNQFRILKCGTTGGCCGRGCQCCDKPRRTAAGEAFSYWAVRGGEKDEKDIYAHCTEECGCCRRYWGFSRVIREDDGSLTCIK